MPTLEWIGKNKVVNHHLEVPYQVLQRVYSYDEKGQHPKDNGSENKIIHGDNLAALKSLLPQYEGKIKCIYIDPPYNTGNEGWVYNDNVNDPRIQKWLGEVVGTQSDDLTRHDKWLCMIYPRLRLLYKLLSDNGAIFISLDDNEIASLKFVMDEIFGSSNFIAQITLLCNPKGRSQDKYFATCHEYLLVYTKTKLEPGSFSVEKNENKIKADYKLRDDNGLYRLIELRNTHREFGKGNRPNLYYPFYASENGEVVLEKDEVHPYEVYPIWPDGYQGCWTWGREKTQQNSQLLIAKKTANRWKIYRKDYAIKDKEKAKQKLFTIWENSLFYTEKGQTSFGKIFSGTNKNDFPQPKSPDYIQEIIRTITSNNDIILDSFAGSGTTAHAVLNLNQQDGGHRKFILIEMMDYADTITAERVKRVIHGYGEGENAVPGTGGSFSYYELGQPIFHGDFLNEEIGLEEIRKYVYFTETRQPAEPIRPEEPAYLGKWMDTVYYFHYARNAATTLNWDFLAKVRTKGESYVMYADRCTLSEEELQKYHITFKKIPRDIARF